MELTKQDKKRIEEETRKLAFRIEIESTEYARLYQIAYLEKLKKYIDEQISIINNIAEGSLEISNNK